MSPIACSTYLRKIHLVKGANIEKLKEAVKEVRKRRIAWWLTGHIFVAAEMRMSTKMGENLAPKPITGVWIHFGVPLYQTSQFGNWQVRQREHDNRNGLIA